MALDSQFYMPGAFNHEGAHSSLFCPPSSSPNSPASSGLLPPSTSPPADDAITSKRKRFREDASLPARQMMFRDPNSTGTAVCETPRRPKASLVSYTLGGRVDSPGATTTDVNDAAGESVYSDGDWRRQLGTKRRWEELEPDPNAPLTSLPGALQAQIQPQEPGNGWGNLAFNTIGGIGGFVGRVWQFCTVGAFQGFQAGGGQAYVMNHPQKDAAMLQDDFLNDSYQQHQQEQDEQNVPGRFPSIDEQLADDIRVSTPPAPSGKRRQTAAPDDLGRNWVMVRDPDTLIESPRKPTPSRSTGSYRPSPRNRNQGPSVATGRRISTPNTRRSMAGRSSLGVSSLTFEAPRRESSASFASPRSQSPVKASSFHQTPPASSPPKKSTPSQQRRSSPPPKLSPMSSHRRSHSNASTASGLPTTQEVLDSSPRLDAEAKRLAARRKMEDRKYDSRIGSANKQIEDMIRQAQEALGTKYEVMNEGEGGWESEDEDML